MGLFKNSYESHEHSLKVLNLLYTYDTFLDSLKSIADMGCGEGHDSKWWAQLMTRDDPPEPRNYKVFAVDKKNRIDPEILKECPNIAPIEKDFENRAVPIKVDLIWSHDSFQHAFDPMKCLAVWKQSLNVDGMLVVCIPQTTYTQYNKLIISNHDRQYYSYNALNLMYMLAMNGFDTRDAYFYRESNSPWLYAAAYATDLEPFPQGTTWHQLIEHNLINQSVVDSINKYGHARIEDLVIRWLDKSLYQITD